MAGTFKTADGQRVAQLLARSAAFQWCGLDADADALRQALAAFAYDTLLRIDIASEGSSSELLRQLMNTLDTQQGDQPIIDTQVSSQERVAQDLARVLFAFLPAPLRSLDAFVRSFVPPTPVRLPSGGPTAPPRVSDALKELARQLAPLALPVAGVTSRWPTVQRLGEELQKRLPVLKAFVKKFACATVASDIETWLEGVPLQAVASQEVAAALETAFESLEAIGQGIVKSSANLGNTVHKSLADAVARDFVIAHRDMVLVAENNVYVPPNYRAIPIDLFGSALERVDRDYSFRVLWQSRGSKDGLPIRGKASEVSREDLIVFKGVLASVLAGSSGSSGLEGRPEVYEVKPMTRLTEAASQVTAYSWNYLWGDIVWKCTKLPGLQGATISNPVMIPADPDFKSISLPTIPLKALVMQSILSSDATAKQIADLVNQVIKKGIVSGPCVAIPFMVTGLYGVIPYFVIDTGQVSQAVEAVIAAALEAMMAALAAYLAAKKAAKQLLEEIKAIYRQIAFAVQQLGTLLLLFVLGIVLIAALLAVLFGGGAAAAGGGAGAALQGAVLLATAALIIIVVAGAAKGGSQGGGDAQAAAATLDVHLGALRVKGITPDQFASWIGQTGSLLRQIWQIKTSPTTVDLTPPG